MSATKIIVGDVVFVTSQGLHCSNKSGVVRHIQNGQPENIGIEFNEDFPGGHNLGGQIVANRGYYVAQKQIVKMLPLSSVLKNTKTKQKKTNVASEPVFILEEDDK